MSLGKDAGRHCIYCGGKGKEGGCEHCGRTPELSLFDGKSEEQIDATINYLSQKMKIPEAYLGNMWSKEVLLEDNTELRDDPQFIQYASSMDAINKLFIRKELPRRTIMITSPTGFSKRTLIYSCIQRANKNRWKTAPLMSTMDLVFLMRKSTEVNPDFKLFGIGYEELYELDLLCVYVPHTDFKYDSFKVLQEIINMRVRSDKSTILISDFSIKDLTSWDQDGNFLQLFKNTSGYLDNKRGYPSVICYRRD